MAAAVGIGRFVYTPILPPMVADLGMSTTTAGLIASANFLGYLAGALLAATPFVPGSRRTWLVVSLAVSAVTTGAMGLASSTVAFLLLRFVGGFASAFVLVFASALVLDRLSAAGRSGLSAVHFAGVGTGITVSAALVSILLALGFGWRALWLASGVSRPHRARRRARVGARSRRIAEGAVGAAARTDEGSRALVVAYGLFGFGYVITATFLVTIVRGAPDVRALEPVVWVVVGVTAIPSVALWTSMARAIGIARAFALAACSRRPASQRACSGSHRRASCSPPPCSAARSWASPRSA